MQFLGDEETVKKAMEAVANQGKAKKTEAAPEAAAEPKAEEVPPKEPEAAPPAPEASSVASAEAKSDEVVGEEQ